MGGARTALYNYCLAKAMGGQFLVRIEDTDAARNTEQALQALLTDLDWLGLNWDLGPQFKGNPSVKNDTTVYFQSQRFALYQSYAEKLIDKGHAYYCFATDEQIESQRNQAKHPAAFQFQSPFKQLTPSQAQEKIQTGEKPVIRFNNQYRQQQFCFTDMVRGNIELPGNAIGDFVLMRADGSPVYNFCCAIDDALMDITHVLRGEEHLPNTLRQLMIYQALELTPPLFGHLSIILGHDQKKLSKRTGAKSIGEFKKEGYLPEAVINALALLGWSDPQHREVFSKASLIDCFDAKRLNAAAPMFDQQKLDWINQEHIRKLSPSDLWKAIAPILTEAKLNLPQQPDWQNRSLDCFKQDWKKLTDCLVNYQFYAEPPPRLNSEGQTWLDQTESHALIQSWLHALQTFTGDRNQPIPIDDYKTIVTQLQTKHTVKGKALFMPIRVAMIGQPQGIDLATAISLFTLEQLINRAKHYLSLAH